MYAILKEREKKKKRNYVAELETLNCCLLGGITFVNRRRRMSLTLRSLGANGDSSPCVGEERKRKKEVRVLAEVEDNGPSVDGGK